MFLIFCSYFPLKLFNTCIYITQSKIVLKERNPIFRLGEKGMIGGRAGRCPADGELFTYLTTGPVYHRPRSNVIWVVALFLEAAKAAKAASVFSKKGVWSNYHFQVTILSRYLFPLSYPLTSAIPNTL